MKTFTDAVGRSWSFAINVATARKLKADTDLDLQGALDGTLLAKLADDAETLAQALWSLCESKAEELGLQPEQFAAGLYGDCIGEAATALIQEIIDFFPNPKRAALQAMWDKAQQLAEEGMQKALRIIEEGGEITTTIGSDSPLK